ncbi:zinc transporter ZntB [Planktotalea arctica]|uniref:zinc transporter ZntB n=1 Tax=Planktotalea arctica TaxID=1481893 RepID=UPI003219FE8E
MALPDPLACFDIDKNGKARSVDLDAKPLPESWRWTHFDLTEPDLENWLVTQVDPLIAAAVLAPETRPRVDAFGDGLIVTLRGVNLNPEADPEDMVSLRLWVTKARVISVRKRRLMALDALRQDAEKGTAPSTSSAFLTALVDGLSYRIENVALQFEEMVDALEESSLDAGANASKECLELRQSIIKLRRFVGPQREALDRLVTDTTIILHSNKSNHLRESANRTARTVEALDATRDRLAAIQEHLDAQTAMKLGRNSYVLSVMAAIFLPLGFLTGLFGVNVAGMPGVDANWAFAGLCIASVLIGAALYAAFRWRDWL